MKRSIRRGVFETNSSSTHSICIVPAEDFEAWKAGKLMYDRCKEELVPPIPRDPNAMIKVEYYDEKLRYWKTKEVPDTLENREEYDYYDDDDDKDVITYEKWQRIGMEDYVAEKTIKGVKVVAFGKYGYDG